MKRIVVFVLVLNAALLGVIAHQLVAIAGGGPVATENGDTNGDGVRNIGDAIYLLQWLFVGGEEPVPVACAQDAGGLTPEQEEILGHMSIEYLPVDEDGNTAKTIRFSGVNVQVVNGTNSTDGDVNGLGNLIVGYQELRGADDDDETDDTNDRSGSHNLVVGKQNNYSIWGGLVVGDRNTVSGYLSTVGSGTRNTASGWLSTVSGGGDNVASGNWSTVSGGGANTASGDWSTVSGGGSNTASGDSSTVSGGFSDAAEGDYSTVSGGINNTASGIASTVSGGYDNNASDDYSTVSGGDENTASGHSSTVSGGDENTASGLGSTVSGGERNTADGMRQHIP